MPRNSLFNLQKHPLSGVISFVFLALLLIQNFSVLSESAKHSPTDEAAYFNSSSVVYAQSQHPHFPDIPFEIIDDEETETEDNHEPSQQSGCICALGIRIFSKVKDPELFNAGTNRLFTFLKTPLYLLFQSWKSDLI